MVCAITILERLLIPGSILELAMRGCVLAKDTLRSWERHFHIRGQAVYRCGGPARRKTCKQNQKRALCVDVVAQTQSAWFIRTDK